MASATVGLAMASCHWSTGIWLVTIVEPRPVSIVNDLQEVTPLIRRQIGETPVVEDQQFDTGYGLEQTCMLAIAACQRQRIEQPWHALIEHRAIVAAHYVRDLNKLTGRDLLQPDTLKILPTRVPATILKKTEIPLRTMVGATRIELVTPTMST